MNQTRATGLSNNGRMFRQRPFLLASIFATGLVFAGVQYKRTAIARNERAQRAARAAGQEPNFYVSVDRSGGGI
ncbi:hypothetical protein F5Y01DRAFT_278191 [Xylaria sp. FL0043]|nr:hypothetical protein F5Y01DRAFT_278191 [Xylaria sp. FL0043]